MSPLLLTLLALSPAAQASGDRLDWRLWSWTSAEALPDLQAESRLRAEEQLRLDMRIPGGWQVDALGAVRDRTMPETDITGDLYRLSLHGNLGVATLGAGRLVRPGVQGFQRIDGLTLDVGRTRQLGVATWAGRLWHPEAWTVGDTYVLGAELQASPGAGALSTVLGAEGRAAEGELGLRVHGLAAIRNTSGARASLIAEVDPLASDRSLPDLRASLGGGLPLASTAELSAAARWEGLTQASQPEALSSPMEWLAGDGYGVLDLGGRVGRGAWAAGASGGPTLRPDADDSLGGLGRAWGTWQVVSPLHLGLTASGATVGASWIAGGVADVRVEQGLLGVQAEGGLFRTQGISGPTADVWEARLSTDAELPIGEPSGGGMRDVHVVAAVATGSDRVLASWVRGGLSLRGSFGTTPEGRP